MFQEPLNRDVTSRPDSLLSLLDSLVEPQGHELGVRDAFTAGQAFQYGDVGRIQAQGYGTADGTARLKGLGIRQELSDLSGVFRVNGGIPVASLITQPSSRFKG
jgi:hypothetical protein